MARARSLDDEASARVRTALDLAVDGQTRLSVNERKEETERLLREAADLLIERDRRGVA